MEINLEALRAEWLNNPLLVELVHTCATARRTSLTTLDWCLKQMDRRYSPEGFNEIMLAFRTLEANGFGRLFQPTQRARARFQWAMLPLVIDSALRDPRTELHPTDLVPEARRMGLTLPGPGPEEPKEPGWTRHEVTLRPQKLAELFVPDDLTLNEAQWLANFILQLAGVRAGDVAVRPHGEEMPK